MKLSKLPSKYLEKLQLKAEKKQLKQEFKWFCWQLKDLKRFEKMCNEIYEKSSESIGRIHLKFLREFKFKREIPSWFY